MKPVERVQNEVLAVIRSEVILKLAQTGVLLTAESP